MKKLAFASICAVTLIVSVPGLAQDKDRGVVVSPDGTVRVEGGPRSSLAAGDYGDGSRVFVRTVQPLFLHGRKLMPKHGGYEVTLSKVSGIQVNGQLYKSMIEPVVDEPARIEDGFFHYVIDRAMRLSVEAYDAGKSQEQVRQDLMAFWSQYADSLDVKSAGRGFILTYNGHSVAVPSGRPSSVKTPDEQIEHYFNTVLVPDFKYLLMYLESGHLVICGQSYMNAIAPADAEETLNVIDQLPDRAQVETRFDGETAYRPIELSGGKYRLGSRAIKDLLSNRQ